MTLEIKKGDCFQLIREQEDNSVDLIITSPPYSDIVNYGKDVSTKNPAEYVEWILPLFVEIHRVLKPTGSFILNINDKTEKGLRSTYIYDLISRNNKETSLKLYDTYIWHKRNGIPNGGTKRFRNTTEFIFHFCKNAKEMKFYMDRVLEDQSETTTQRYRYNMTNRQGEIVDGVRVRKKVKRCGYEKTASGETLRFNYYEDRYMDSQKVRPDNVFRFSTAAASRDNFIKHPAPFHKELPLYFINLLTDEGDLVIDPFSGIGTTGVACKELSRNYIGYELNGNYVDYSIKRLRGEALEKWVVNQYNLEHNFIKSWPSASAAGTALNLCIDDIMRCYARNGFNTCGGYIWKLEKEKITKKNEF